jgi:hypothetical protein
MKMDLCKIVVIKYFRKITLRFTGMDPNIHRKCGIEELSHEGSNESCDPFLKRNGIYKKIARLLSNWGVYVYLDQVRHEDSG